MLSEGREELICDMAETYGVFDIHAIPLRLLATLAAGLRPNARIRMKMSGFRYIPPEIIFPQIYDLLQLVFRDKDSEPKLLTSIMLGGEKENDGNAIFASGEDFLKAREKIVEGIRNG